MPKAARRDFLHRHPLRNAGQLGGMQEGAMRLSAAQLSALREGLDWRHVGDRGCGSGAAGRAAQWNQPARDTRYASPRVIQSRHGSDDGPALRDDPGTLKAMLLPERARAERAGKELHRPRFRRRAETLRGINCC